MVNLIHFQTNQFLLQSLCIKMWFEKRNECCFLLAPESFRESLTKIGLDEFIDVIFEKNLNTYLSTSNYSEINIVIHHYDTQLNSYPNIINNIVNRDYSFKVSYFADGFVNAFLNLPLAADKNKEFPAIIPKYAFSFDYTMKYFADRMPDVEHIQIESDLLVDVFNKFNFYSHLSKGIEDLRTKIDKDYLCLILVMRPWGSDAFHGGNYALENGAESLCEIVVKMIEDIKSDVGEDFLILYRRDNRDKKIMDDFEKLLKENTTYWKSFIDIGNAIPDFLTLDSFFYFFTNEISKNMMTSVFDSTTSLPLIKLKKGVRHYLGADNCMTEKLQNNQNMTKIYSNKVNLSRKYIAASNIAGVYDEREITKGFYCFRKLTNE
jgi:hypothetical protein